MRKSLLIEGVNLDVIVKTFHICCSFMLWDSGHLSAKRASKKEITKAVDLLLCPNNLQYHE